MGFLNTICDRIVNVCCKEKQIANADADIEIKIDKNKDDDKNVNPQNSKNECDYVFKIKCVPQNKLYFNHIYLATNKNPKCCKCMQQQSQNLPDIKKIIFVPSFYCSCLNDCNNYKCKTSSESGTQIPMIIISEEETMESIKLSQLPVTDCSITHSEFNCRKIDDGLNSTEYIPCCKQEIKNIRNNKTNTFPVTSTKVYDTKCKGKQSFSKSFRTLFQCSSKASK